ncbi:DUF2145 domain-containing protein [Pseudoxanthomonas sacheonensis]|uniref:DUF2145 domain-containing protein n=1 Tax=Pseudoxanthomonas sacheonensis TaxID=443615 RepID=UPI0013D5AA84|nr:DUF2145 domain-containing protein [Pseudoxanthomonas sacheonensis]KAF1712898.1 hypothetical protein CSC73_01035 [Pseudoxanthomonas sacheonensis]
MKLSAWFLALCLAWPLAAIAGRQCEIRPATPQKLADATVTAMRVVAALEETDAPVVLVARVGTDLSKHGLVYSHIGFALRDHSDGRWTVLHLLNECGTARSALHAQGLVNFFADDLVNQDARIVWLQPALAQRLADHLRGLPRNALHEQAYNLIARPGSREYQNSTEWVLETLAAVATTPELGDRRTAYAWAQRDGFKPDTIHIAYAKRVLGGLFGVNTIFTDHSVGTRLSGDYPVVTVRSILRYLQERGYAVHVIEWRDGLLQSIPGAT